MTKKEKKVTSLFDTFAGEYVSVMLDKEITQHIQIGQSIESVKVPINFEGYLTEMCDSYIYLGQIPGTISQAIKTDTIFHIQVTAENNVMQELIESGEIPEDEKEWQ